MPKYQIEYTTFEGATRRATISGPDQACAIGILLDERDDVDDRRPMTVAPFGKLAVAKPTPTPKRTAPKAPKARPKAPPKTAQSKPQAKPAKRGAYDPSKAQPPESPDEVRSLLDYLRSSAV